MSGLGMRLGLRRFGVGGGSKAPFLTDALFWLDGTISGDTFVDKSGNDRNFTITGKDFSTNWTKGFPYKSAATISAPVGDVTLIAADINNYLYDSGGTPNQIPVISLFQDIDYEHKLFTRHIAQVLNGNGVETSQPYVADIVLYSTVKATTDLITCQTYYGVPVEKTTGVKWVSKTGNDTTGNGTKDLPWLTLIKAEAAATTGDTIYVKSGIYTEITQFIPKLDRDWVGIGFNTVRTTGTTYVLFTNDDNNNTLSGFIFDGETNTTSILYIYKPAIFNKCMIINSKVGGQAISNRNVPTFINSIICDGRVEMFRGFEFNTCYFNSYMFNDGTLGDYERFINCKIIANTAINASWSGTINAASEFTLKGCDINVIDCGYFIISTGAITSTLSITFCKINIIDYETYFINNASGGFSDIIISDNTIINNKGVYSNLLTNTKNATIERNILYDISAAAFGDIGAGSDIVINDNTVVINIAATYGVAVGKENSPTTQANSITILNNRIFGQRYFTPDAEPTSHGLFVGYQSAITNIKYNYIDGAGIGVVLKGSNTDYANTILQSNIITNSALYGVYCKAVNNANIIGNTIVENRYEIDLGNNVGGDDAVGTVIKNNILYNTSGAIYALSAGSLAGSQTIDYNNIYYTDELSGTRTLEEWQALGYDVNSQISDPLLTDFIPSVLSPAIGNGVDLGATYDDCLDTSTNWGDETTLPVVVTKQQGAEWDIGAYKI